MSPRAAAMTVDDRRASIVEAALPLLRAQGAAVTTKEIAAAAGIAEGTVFRVFESKDEIVRACVADAVDTADEVRALKEIDRALPLERRLEAGVDIMRAHIEVVIGMMSMLHATGVPPMRPQSRQGPPRRDNPEIDAAFVDLIGDDVTRLRQPVARVVRYLSMLTLASAHPMRPQGDRVTSAEIVDVLLHGALAPEGENA